ncbi:hypothetical protein ACQPYK_02595 [Streptosporangium sp. CA-135522]
MERAQVRIARPADQFVPQVPAGADVPQQQMEIEQMQKLLDRL